ncbi:MAG: RtcB family protein [Ginsengibacter sp.]
MNRLKLSGKQLRAIGFPEAPVISIAMSVMEKNYKYHSEEDALQILKSIFENPGEYLDDAVLGKIAAQFIEKPVEEIKEIPLNETGIHYNIFGAENIEEGALKQMEIAAKLPVAVAGALMPDAHQGYGLPIGGVLATNNAIIPYAIGVDIGCRMCMSIFPIETSALIKKASFFQRELLANTLFGPAASLKTSQNTKCLREKNLPK